MPVSSDQIPLDTAKRWAKRLAKHTANTPHPMTLSQAQGALAHMLGFPHWHALSAGLNQTHPPRKIQNVVIRAGEPLDDPLPGGDIDWKQYWEGIISRGGVLHLSYRGSHPLKLRRVILGCATFSTDIPKRYETEALRALLGVSSLSEIKNAIGRTSFGHRYKIIPVYPQGYDVSILLDKGAAYPRRLGLDKAQWKLISKHIQPGKLLLIHGRSGQGKDTLAAGLGMDMLKHGKKVAALRCTYAWRWPDVSSVMIKPGQDQRQAVSAIMRAGTDLIVSEEMHGSLEQNKKHAAAIKVALDSGCCVVLPMIAGSPQGAVELLNQLCAGLGDKVGFSLRTELLPQLCLFCKVRTTGGESYKRGKGCIRCSDGARRRKLIVECFSHQGGRFSKVGLSLVEGAASLVEAGDLDRKDAEEVLGPLPSLASPSEPTEYIHDGEI